MHNENKMDVYQTYSALDTSAFYKYQYFRKYDG